METSIVILFGSIFFSQAILFFLKILRFVSWDWLWILAPLWIPYVFILVMAILAGIILLFIYVKEGITKWKKII